MISPCFCRDEEWARERGGKIYIRKELVQKLAGGRPQDYLRVTTHPSLLHTPIMDSSSYYHYRRQRQQRSSSSSVSCYVVILVFVVIISTPRCCVALVPSSRRGPIHHRDHRRAISSSPFSSGRKVEIGPSRSVSRRRRRRPDRVEGESTHSNRIVVEIGVGVDLGTTNSAVAMLINRQPAMIRVDSDDDNNSSSNDNEAERSIRRSIQQQQQQAGVTTIPSVVAFECKNIGRTDYCSNEIHDDDNDDDADVTSTQSLINPPKKEEEEEEWTFSSLFPTADMNDRNSNNNNNNNSNRYKDINIIVGNDAERHEQQYPQHAYRNVKRIIGTGGKAALLMTGIVPNLFVPSENESNSGGSSSTSSSVAAAATTIDEFTAIFGNNDNADKSNSNKLLWKPKTKKGKRESKQILPKLRKQLEDATDDPAYLTFRTATATENNDDDDDTLILIKPEQISACILRKLYDAAEKEYSTQLQQQTRVTRAVIGVPAYFTEAQRQATIKASELAGVSKVRLIAEPEAAALAYQAQHTTIVAEELSSSSSSLSSVSELVLVFDLGGGTFDVSILEMGDGISEVLATMGNNRLGGTDFDRRLADYLCDLAVEYGRGTNNNNDVAKSKTTTTTTTTTTRRKASKCNDHIDNNELVRRNNESNERRRQNNQSIIKNWYRFGTNEVSSIILRLAEKVRISLSNQKSVQIVLPLTENGWQRVMSTTDDNDGVIIGPKFDKSRFEAITGMMEGNDYTIVTIDRKSFESVCINELNLLLQPLREVAIMARVMLPGEARPSYVENAMAELLDKGRMGDDEDDDYDDEDEFWKSDDKEASRDDKDDADDDDDDDDDNNNESQFQSSERAYQLLQAMNVKSQKKAQQKGRKMSRDIDKRERSFRKQKQSAAEEASMTLLLGNKRIGVSGGGGAAAMSSSQTTSKSSISGGSSSSNVRIQEGIHGRALSRVILVGGATRMPVISKLLEAVVGMVPQRTVNPDEAVALGCAVQVGILDGENDKLSVLSPMQAAVMRALAIKEQRRIKNNDNSLAVPTSGGRRVVGRGNDELSMKTALKEQGMDESMKEIITTMGGMIVVDEFDDEDDFY